MVKPSLNTVMDMQSMNGTNFASICQPVVSVLKKPRFCFKDPGLAKTYSTRTRRKFDTCLSEDCGLNDKKARRFSNLRALEGLKTQRFRPQYLFHLPVWCARLDSNQRPTESELSGHQRRNPGFMRVSGTSHKIRTHLQKTWKPLQRLGSHGFSGFWKIVVKQ